jgi:adenylate kinase family enzyme
MKIAVIGYSGSGKSTLAKSLGEKHHCAVLHLDTVNFESGWKERNRTECKAIITEFMKNSSWVIDGNYIEFLQERRLEEADQIIFMNFPAVICFLQAYRRYRSCKNQVRESMAQGCEEKFDFEFAKWILFDGRTKKIRHHYRRVCNRYKDKVVVCRNRKAVSSCMKG